MSTAQIDGMDLLNVNAEDLTPLVICDQNRTASGRMRRDVSTVKRSWQLTTDRLTQAQSDALLNMLAAKSYGLCQFWLDSFGATTNTVGVYVTMGKVPRMPFAQNGVWDSNGRTLTMTILEA